MEQSESVAALAAALSAAQGEVENAAKSSANPHFKSRFADLAEIINTVRPVLSRHGLAVVQMPGFADGVVTVETTLLHKSGEWMRGTSAAPAAKMDPQGVGSATTYLRRYSLAALCCIAQEDDDGNAASHTGTPPSRQDSAPQTADLSGASEKQLGMIRKLMQSHHIVPSARASLEKRIAQGMDKRKASEAIDWLTAEIEAAKGAEP